MQRYVELIQGQRQAHAVSLDVGFLARPAAKKRLAPQPRRQGTQGSCLAWREKAFGQEFAVALHLAKTFHINTDLPPACHCKEGQAVRMREIESKIALMGEPWLAVVTVGEAHLFRAKCQVFGQQNTHDPARGREMAAIFLEMETV